MQYVVAMQRVTSEDGVVFITNFIEKRLSPGFFQATRSECPYVISCLPEFRLRGTHRLTQIRKRRRERNCLQKAEPPAQVN